MDFLKRRGGAVGSDAACGAATGAAATLIMSRDANQVESMIFMIKSRVAEKDVIVSKVFPITDVQEKRELAKEELLSDRKKGRIKKGKPG